MAPTYHPTPLSGCDRANEKRAAGEALIREADDLACQSWNERMWADGGPIDPSPTIDQAINGGYAGLEIACSRCKTPRNVDLCALPHVPSTCVHDLAGRLRCSKCTRAGKRPLGRWRAEVLCLIHQPQLDCRHERHHRAGDNTEMHRAGMGKAQ
jgi:hypothetical protein